MQTTWNIWRQVMAQAYIWRKLVMASLIAVLLIGTTGSFISLTAANAAMIRTGMKVAPYKGSPNHFHVPAAPDRSGPYPGPAPAHMRPVSASVDTTLHHPFTPTMKELVIPLTRSYAASPNQPPTVQAAPADVTGSDGTLEVQVPANALTSADIAAAGGSARLVVDQVAGLSGSVNDPNGSGRIIFGEYTFQVQNAKGQEIPTSIALRQPLTLIYHWHGTRAPIPFTLEPVNFTLNPALPLTVPHKLLHAGAPQQFRTTYDPKTTSLKVIVPLSQSGGGAFSATSPVSYFGKPDAFQNDLHTGSLNDTIAIDVPSGPGGLTPPLNLSYSSEAVAETHSPTAAASWVGVGWSLDPGEISWSEQNIPAPNGTQNEVDGWSISDPYGTSGALLPPNTTTATYYDDTPNPPSGVTNWRTATESHAKIVSYENPTVDCTNFPEQSVCGTGGYGVQPPCFRVWLPNGIMEEFGCTFDSRQFYPAGTSTTNYVTAWKLDLITDPMGNQIHFTYGVVNNTQNGITYPMDSVLQSVAWDAPNCHNANDECSGSSWNPTMEVLFDYSHAVGHVAPGGSVCTQSGTLRCDDPKPGAQESIPLSLSTEVLNEIDVNVAGSGSFQLLRKYVLAYAQAAGSTITDVLTGSSEAVAGHLLLEQVTEDGTDGSTHYPTQTFAYTYPGSEYYEDGQYTPTPTSDCGPAWNTGKRTNGLGNCVLWFQTYNSYLLSSADNGMGLHTSYTWQDMRTNQHGVDTSAPAPDNDPQHAYACTDLQATKSTGWNVYPCDLADDNGWSHLTLTSRTEQIDDPLSNNSSYQVKATWTYNYNLAALTAQECSDCQYGMYWGNANDGDIADFYNGKFTGFSFAQSINPDGSLENDSYYSTEGWGVWDNTKVACHDGQSTCPNSPAWDLTNAASGRAFQVDEYGIKQNGVYPLLKRTQTTYAAICPTATVAATPAPSSGIYAGYTWNNHLVSEVDQDNPAALCDIQTTGTTTYQAEGQSSPTSSTSPMQHTAYTYDTNHDYGHLLSATTTGNDLGSTPTIVQTYAYIWNNAISTTSTSATGTYIVDRRAFTDTEDGSGNRKACTYVYFDNLAYGTGANSGLIHGLADQTDKYTTCTQSGGTGVVTTKQGYDTNGDLYWTLDADSQAGISGHTGCTIGTNNFTTCTTYSNLYSTQVATQTNDKGQTTTENYSTSSGDGYGLWPSGVTDANGQTTSATYDALGRTISTTLPGETSGETTTSTSYSFSACPATGASAPCYVVDRSQRLDSSTTVTEQSYYDGWGHLLETRTPAPTSQDTIQFAQYDSLGQPIFLSQPYFVASGTGYSTPDMSQPGTSTQYDGLGRMISLINPISATTSLGYAASCNVAGLGDSACYEATTQIDANGHKQAAYEDALGRTSAQQDWTGTSSSGFTLYRTIKESFDYLFNLATKTYADGSHTATATYNALDELVSSTDPNQGNYSYTYDPNGNLTSSVDARGTAGSVFYNYDGLNRTIWESTNSDGSSPFASYSYDSTANGNVGIGRLTSETFASGPNQAITGSYAYSYDGRGRTTSWTETINATTYPFLTGYNDADQPTTLTYPDGDLITTSYSQQGWLAGVTEKLGSNPTTTFLNSVSYQGSAGASGHPSNAVIANGTDAWSSIYDAALRLTDLHVQQGASVLFDQTRGYDAVANTLITTTQFANGTQTDNQAFCYDDLDRLTWAGATGTPPCQSLTAGTLTSAAYQQSYSYDVLDRFTNGPSGNGYTYGDPNHIDAVTSAPNYSASYDAAGEMTSRNGQALTYDALQRLISWQNTASNPTSTASYGYDGAGERVEQQTTTNGTTTTTYYIGPYEEISTTGSQTTTTKYYNGGVTAAVSVNGSISYLVQDGLGSVVAALDATGNVTANQLYLPYGGVRYQSGALPTSYGFTSQHSDPSGLLYDQARYYDPSSGAFISADDTDGSCYVYVHNNPESATDPSGHGANDNCSKAKALRDYLITLYQFVLLFNQLLAAASSHGLSVTGSATNLLIDIAETAEMLQSGSNFGIYVNKAAALIDGEALANDLNNDIMFTSKLIQLLCGDDPGAGLGAQKTKGPRGGGPNTPYSVRGKSQSSSKSSRPGKGRYFGQVFHHETKEEIEFMHMNEQGGGTIPGVGYYDPLSTSTETSGGSAVTCDILCWIGIGIGIGISVGIGFSDYQPAASPSDSTTPPAEDVNGPGTGENGGGEQCVSDAVAPCQK